MKTLNLNSIRKTPAQMESQLKPNISLPYCQRVRKTDVFNFSLSSVGKKSPERPVNTITLFGLLLEFSTDPDTINAR